jgi:hypothetical protein
MLHVYVSGEVVVEGSGGAIELTGSCRPRSMFAWGAARRRHQGGAASNRPRIESPPSVMRRRRRVSVVLFMASNPDTTTNPSHRGRPLDAPLIFGG